MVARRARPSASAKRSPSATLKRARRSISSRPPGTPARSWAQASDDYAKAEYQRQIRMEEINAKRSLTTSGAWPYLQATDDYLNAIAQANAKAAEQVEGTRPRRVGCGPGAEAQVKEARAAKALADFQASAARGESQMQAAAGVGIGLRISWRRALEC